MGSKDAYSGRTVELRRIFCEGLVLWLDPRAGWTTREPVNAGNLKFALEGSFRSWGFTHEHLCSRPSE